MEKKEKTKKVQEKKNKREQSEKKFPFFTLIAYNYRKTAANFVPSRWRFIILINYDLRHTNEMAGKFKG